MAALSPPPPLTEPPPAPAQEASPAALRAAWASLSGGDAASAAATCAQVEDAALAALHQALRRARIDGRAEDAATVRALLAAHLYETPPLLAVHADRFMLAGAARDLCLRAAWLAGREDLKARWLPD